MSTIPTAARSSVQMTTYPIDALQHVTMIHVGRQTETGVECIRFDCSAWLARWPGMELSVWPTAPGSDTAYEAQTHMDGNVIVWDVSGSDTITPGKGYVEVLGMVDGRRKLSARVQTMVAASGLAATADPPERQQPWFERALAAVAGVPEAVAKELQEAKDSGVFDGADGISPTVSVEDIDGGHRVTITDKDGDKTFEVMDGDAGKYDLIETIVLSEETKQIERTQEPDGTPYAFTAAYVKVESPAAAEKNYTQARFYGPGNNYNITLYNGNGLEAYERKWIAYAYPEYGRMTGRCTLPVASKDGVPGAWCAPIYMYNFGIADKIARVVVNTGGVYPVGTKIEIWGVRANA